MIEEDLYRSGQPNELNFPFLEKLGLKTVVWLAPEEPNQRLYVEIVTPLDLQLQPWLRQLSPLTSQDYYSFRRSLVPPLFSMDFVDDQDIHLYHLGVVSSMNAWDPITEEVVLEASELILTPKNYPMIVMCNLGRHRTGNQRTKVVVSSSNSQR